VRTDGDMREPVDSAPSDASVFGVPPGTTWFMFGGAAVFTAFAALGLALAVSKSDRFSVGLGFVAAVGFGSLATLGLRSFTRLRARIALNETGIWYLPHSGKCTFIPWKDVSNVKADDTGQRLVLTDASKRREIRVEYQLQHFKNVRDSVLAHSAAQIHEHASSLTCFHRTWVNKVIFAVVGSPFLIISWVNYKQGLNGMPLFFPLCFGIMAGIMVVMDPLRGSITSEAVTIEYPGWKRTILFDSITRIAIEDVHSRGNAWAAVVIERKKNGPIKLFRFNEGSVALHDALQTAWINAGQRKEPADRC